MDQIGPGFDVRRDGPPRWIWGKDIFHSSDSRSGAAHHGQAFRDGVLPRSKHGYRAAVSFSPALPSIEGADRSYDIVIAENRCEVPCAAKPRLLWRNTRRNNIGDRFSKASD